MIKIRKENISVIIPVHNEEETVFHTIKNIKELMERHKRRYELIVVNDGSTDRSKEEILKTENVILIDNPYWLGYGASIKKGIRASKYELILIIDADGTYPVETIPSLLEHIHEYDMIVGARKLNLRNISIPKMIAKNIITFLSVILTGRYIPDINSGLRVFKKDIALRFMHLFPSGFSLTTTLTLACLTNDYTIKYVKINYLKRKENSNISPLSDFIRFISTILKTMIYFKPLKMFSLLAFLILLFPTFLFFFTLLYYHRVMFDTTIAILTLTSIQIFCLGLLADLLIKEK